MMKIKWVELKEDDPIFKGGFIISPINIKAPKKTDKNDHKKETVKSKRNKKKGD